MQAKVNDGKITKEEEDAVPTAGRTEEEDGSVRTRNNNQASS